MVQLTEGILDHGNHSTMTSKKTTQDTEGTSLRTNTSSYKIRKFNGKIEISQGSKKSNIILRGLEGHPKTLM